MRQPEKKQKGTVGQTAVKLFFERLGWGPLETGEHDLGTDIFVQMRAADRNELGLMIGVQVKTGSSFFAEPAKQEGAKGWWFRDSKAHSDYWLNHHIPHIVVLLQDGGKKGWWAPLDQSTLERTKSGGIRAFVSKRSALSKTSAQDWISLAVAHQKQLALQGAAWSFNLNRIPTTEWARYALLAPRLVAPHPNRSPSEHGALLWPEAVALCVRADPNMWERFATEYPDVPTCAKAGQHSDAGWRLAGRVFNWVTGGTWVSDPAAQSDSALVAADSVCSALSRFDEGDLESAIEVTERSLAELLPAGDRGWLEVIRARLLLESGERDRSAEAFHAANTALAAVTRRDPTVDSLRAASLSGLFNLDPFGQGRDLGGLIQAGDSAPSWWRGQQIAGALESLTDEMFNGWAGHESVQLIENAAAHNGLYSAFLNARLCGSWETARSTLSLLARADLMLGRTDPSSSLRDLRVSGDHKELTKAVSHLRRRGPLAPVSALLNEVRPTFYRSTAQCDIELLARAGTMCDPAQAASLIDSLTLELVAPTWLTQSRGPLPRHRVVDAICSLSGEISPHQTDKIALFMLSLDEGVDRLTLDSLVRLAGRLSPSAEHRDAAVERLDQLPLESPVAKVLAAMAGEGSAVRLEVADRLLRAGDLEGLHLMHSWDAISPELAANALGVLRMGIEGERLQTLAEGSVATTFGSWDYIELLARMILFGPDVEGSVDLLVDAIGDTSIPVERKRDTCLLLARHSDRVPEERRLALHTALSSARGQLESGDGGMPTPSGFYRPIGGAVDVAWLELHPNRDEVSASAVPSLLASSATKADCVVFLGLHTGWAPVLIALLSDRDLEVSSNAAEALAYQLGSSTSADEASRQALTSAVAQGGESVAAAVLRGLSHASSTPGWNSSAGVLAVLEALAAHQSPLVRRAAMDLLTAHTDELGR